MTENLTAVQILPFHRDLTKLRSAMTQNHSLTVVAPIRAARVGKRFHDSAEYRGHGISAFSTGFGAFRQAFPSSFEMARRVACPVYAQLNPDFESGKVRIRLPVAPKMALATAGRTGGKAGSPKPVGVKSLFSR